MKYIYLYIFLACTASWSNACFAQKNFDAFKMLKSSGRYFYGESDGMDTIELKKHSRSVLVNTISRHYMNSITSTRLDSALSIKTIDYLVMAYGMKYKVIAFTDTGNIVISQRKPTNEFNIVEVKSPKESDNEKNTPIAKPQLRSGGNAIPEILIQFKIGTEAMRFLVSEARKNKLVFTTNESSVLNTEDCYILILDKVNDKVLAILSKGAERTELSTNKVVTDFKKQYSKFEYIWVHVY